MAGNPLVRPGMNAPGEGVFLIVRQPVEDIERGGKQDFRQQALVHPFPSLRSNSFTAAAITAAAPFLGTGGRPGRLAIAGFFSGSAECLRRARCSYEVVHVLYIAL